MITIEIEMCLIACANEGKKRKIINNHSENNISYNECQTNELR